MRIFGDYHTHTVMSHGKGTVRDNVEYARRIGLKDIAITDHGLNHIILGLNWKKVEQTVKEIEELREEYRDINILMGIEANIIGTRGRIDIKKEQVKRFDIILCGFHKPARPDRLRDYLGMYMRAYLKFVPQGVKAVKRNTEAYINAIRNNPIDVLTHINKCIKVDCGKIAEVCAEYGTFIELSVRHNTFNDNDYRAMLATNVKFIVNSDAHKVEDIANVEGIERIIDRYAIPQERIVNIEARPKFRSGYKGDNNGI